MKKTKQNKPQLVYAIVMGVSTMMMCFLTFIAVLHYYIINIEIQLFMPLFILIALLASVGIGACVGDSFKWKTEANPKMNWTKILWECNYVEGYGCLEEPFIIPLVTLGIVLIIFISFFIYYRFIYYRKRGKP